MNYIGKEASYRLLRFALSIALALFFWAVGVFVPPMLSSVSEVGGYLTWVVLTLVGVIFLVRALFDALVLSDKAIGAFLNRLGVKERWSRRRIYKNLVYIIAIILAAAAVSPFFSDLGSAGNTLRVLTTYVTLGAILLFVYDIGRTIYRIAEEKANSVADWLLRIRNKDAK